MSESKVYFVGAGPGDPGLITVKGAIYLEMADCVIYDGLANPALLDHCRPDAETISVAKRSGHHSFKQDQINALVVEKAKQYKTVVRLKGGDPCLFGRAAEEIKTCLEAGLEFEIVPGITAGVAAAEYAGIFLTDRDHTSAVCFVTGHEAEGKDHTDLDWDNLAGFNGSLVIYMGMGNLAMIARTLIDKGKAADTPVAVVHQATRPQQKVVKAALSDIDGVCKTQDIGAPSIVVIGPAAAGINGADWFSERPLFGKKIIITRDAAGNESFADALSLQSAEPVRFNTIELVSLADMPPVQKALQQLGDYDWIIFTSANGVRHTFDALEDMTLDARVFADTKIACIGIQTATELAVYGLNADFVPATFTSTALAQGLVEMNETAGKSILLLRSAIAPDELPKALTAGGATVEDVSVYTVDQRTAAAEEVTKLIGMIKDSQVDWITFTSSSTVDSFFAQIDIEAVKASSVKIASIGPFTTKQLANYGMKPDVEASPHTVNGLIDAMATG